jgi:hypothetical protein
MCICIASLSVFRVFLVVLGGLDNNYLFDHDLLDLHKMGLNERLQRE